MVTKTQIKIGSKLKSMGIVLEITEINEKKEYFKGFQEYKGKKIEMILFFTTLENPHYNQRIEIIGA